MKRGVLSAGLIVLATQAAAFDRMTLADCQDSLSQLETVFGAETGLVRAVNATFDGWCRFDGSDALFQDDAFDVLDWRLQGTDVWAREGIPPLAIEVRATGLSPDVMEGGGTSARPDLVAQILLRQHPDAGQLILERAVLENAAGDVLSVSGVFERVFLSSTAMMQVSMGSAAFKAGLMSMTLTGVHEDPFAFGIDIDVRGEGTAMGRGAFEVISRLPEGVMDAASRAELTAYASDLPSPVGTLEVIASSERGLGLMQLGTAMYQSFVARPDLSDPSSGLDVMLDGVTIRADWSPATPVAD